MPYIFTQVHIWHLENPGDILTHFVNGCSLWIIKCLNWFGNGVARKKYICAADFLKYAGPAGPGGRKLWGPTECLFYYLSVKR